MIHNFPHCKIPEVKSFSQRELTEYIGSISKPVLLQRNSHLKYPRINSGHFRIATENMKVFKVANSYGSIVNLIVLKGTHFFLRTEAGMAYPIFTARAESAITHSISNIAPDKRNAKPIREARSIYNPRFKYSIGDTATPDRPFSSEPYIYGSGIHFVFSLYEALSV